MENTNQQQMPQPLAQMPAPPQRPANPLASHFRQPRIHLSLPSKGQWWPTGALELPVTGEVPIYAMSSREEVLLRTPDGLMNGQSVVTVIQNCCPSIKDAWNMPSVDTDAVLIAIRIASFGDNMDVQTVCPSCNEENTYAVGLGEQLGKLSVPNYNIPLDIDNLQIYFDPQPYSAVTRLNQLRFQEQRISNTIVDLDMPENEKRVQLEDSFQRIIDLNVENLTASTRYIVTENGEKVTDPIYIKEFYDNCDTSITRKLQEKIIALGDEAGLKPLKVQCQECKHEYESSIEFDYANFFGEASSD